MRRQKGFSLIELLIVVAIILIIAAIAIPNLIRSRIAANNSAAAASIRTLNTAEATYTSTYGQQNGYATLAQLGPPAAGTQPSATNAGVVDQVLGCSAGVSGAFCTRDAFNYTITIIGASNQDYVIFATPTSNNVGNKDYCSAPDMVIYGQPSTATPPDAAVATDAACQALTAI